MVVVVDVGRNGRVVIVPLLDGNNAISIAVTETGHELYEDFFVSHLATNNLRVSAAVVDDAQVSRCDGAVTISVKLCKALVDNFLSGFVGHSSDTVEELVITDDTILVGVEVLEEDSGLTLRHGCA